MSAALARTLAAQARDLYARGLTTSTGGNLSHRAGDGFLVSGTNTAFARQVPEDFARCDAQGAGVSGPAPSKEAAFHAAVYRARPGVQAVLHLHAAASLTLSCLARPDERGNVLPVHSSYAVTRVGRVPLLPYDPPGSAALARAVERHCPDVNALLLQNHGVITWGRSLDEARDILEELEQNVGVWLASRGQARVLSDEELQAANARAGHGAPVQAGTQRPQLLAHVQGWSA
ncbi:class II aldolase/adducin family protein (plasmid) [Deinococcus taeanensis]|uniref:class II aldolase/adducin family protein n=1 Tax=Deinococcus taeanensis TaxID=2737050 RepID=UPI001CDBBBDE|nr:class II aldolase/adducin family protein [Deinococcus taeanensis]UBV44265.1 class II aldolase/adducin family protein [Deinococcus taeanensis]